MSIELLIATRNPGKINELRGLLGTSDYQLIGLDAFPDVPEIEETGLTFSENACLKAAGYARQTGLLALADDSGLEVDALDGRPGVLSARYGGEDMPFAEKMALLLAEMEKSDDLSRRARFVCAIAVANPGGEILAVTEGVCPGTIAAAPRGSGGFGYDPLFIPDGFDQTFGELPDAVKQEISHRFRAFLEIIPFLRRFKAV
jgi:XTP/dITP diphosphohydrolase